MIADWEKASDGLYCMSTSNECCAKILRDQAGRLGMPNIKSQVKRMKQSEKRRTRTRAVKSSLKTYVKRFNTAYEAGETEDARAAYKEAARALDKAVSKGVIHKNKAANKKSSMSRALNALK